MSLYVFKVIILGSGAVGKTSLLYRFVENRFAIKYKMTIGADFLSKIIESYPKPGNTVKFQIWDIGGQDQYKFLRPSFFEGANGALLVFDLTRWHTFEELNDWYSDLQEYAGKNTPFILLGNKVDMIQEENKTYNKESANFFAKKKKTYFVETSAKTGENVEDVFLNLATRMLKNVGYK
ncbi:MAG: Rab family GTPase [Promethearchaeota archaeon]